MGLYDRRALIYIRLLRLPRKQETGQPRQVQYGQLRAMPQLSCMELHQLRARRRHLRLLHLPQQALLPLLVRGMPHAGYKLGVPPQLRLIGQLRRLPFRRDRRWRGPRARRRLTAVFNAGPLHSPPKAVIHCHLRDSSLLVRFV